MVISREQAREILNRHIEQRVDAQYQTVTVGRFIGGGRWEQKAAPPGYVAITLEDGLEAEAYAGGKITALPGQEIEVQRVNGQYVVRGTAVKPAQEGNNAPAPRGLDVGLHGHNPWNIHFVPFDEASMIDGGMEVEVGTTNIKFKRKMYINSDGRPQVYPGGDTVDVQGTYGNSLAGGQQAWVLVYINPSTGALSFHEANGADAPIDSTTDFNAALVDFATSVTDGKPYGAIRVGRGAVNYKRYKPASRYDFDNKDIIRFYAEEFTTLASLTDTNISGLTTRDVLYYDGTEIVNQALSADDIQSGVLLHERGGLEADVSGYDGIPFISAGSTSEIKYNLSATSDPDEFDDTGLGYEVGSIWVNTSRGRTWQCVDATDNAAVWQLIGGVYGVSAGLSADQTIPDTTLTTVIMDSVNYDPDSMLNTTTGIITIPRTGLWTVSAGVIWQNSSVGSRLLRILGSGSLMRFRNDAIFSSDAVITIDAASLTDGDAIEYTVQQISGGSLDVLSNSATFLSARYIGEL